ncbi:hypothetical protein LguiA_031675 [Lonicera macranthoides]
MQLQDRFYNFGFVWVVVPLRGSSAANREPSRLEMRKVRFLNKPFLLAPSSSTSHNLIEASPASTSSPNSFLPFSPSFPRNVASTPFVKDEAETGAFPRFLDEIFDREGPGTSYGLNWALAGKGVIVKDKAFRNLKPYELEQKGATVAGNTVIVFSLFN